MKIDVLTLFPEFFESPLKTGIIKKGLDEGLITVNPVDLRDFTTDRHKTADDAPFGGGAGMVMKPEPIFRAVRHIQGGRIKRREGKPRIILLTPQGRRFSDREAKRLREFGRLVLICGRYEGVDERVSEGLVDDEISIGDYILSGGEVAALVIIEAVARLVEGVVGKRESVEKDSFSNSLLKYPQYTRPSKYLGMEVPEILLSGDHEKIAEWRLVQSVKRTLSRRPDILEGKELSEKERLIIEDITGGKPPKGG
ncbi:MAG: tRNA (guanosine(37)-N1)-methyltransferase TrmD [Deltaproteobacteria bacterium]|uniref:tRNA (guanine-N(1)-)-methyltransferase n=1 Tax=Candidatus Zymogenus saltonus TaxID=2844893 RepID=A0A9D8KG10_9DELT|nr:tRNA (guanosine(37)-N1)-methyltransferase TrmD [Candidatus Zymogenus saltonus]